MKRRLFDFLIEIDAGEELARALCAAYERLCADHGEGVLTDAVSGYYASRAKTANDVTRALDGVAAESGVHAYTLDALFVALSYMHIRDGYVLRHGEEIFLDSARDLTYKLRECHGLYGIVGTRAISWHNLLLREDLFALGRLQFHVVSFPFDGVTVGGVTVKKGDPVLKTHIPSSGPLLREECLDSYRRAYRFFRDKMKSDLVPFVCFSWLLSPRIAAGYPEGSNLAGFYSDFHIFARRDDEKNLDLWRVFGVEYTEGMDVAALPRTSALRAHLGSILDAGGCMENGYGIFLHDGENTIK